MLNRRLFQKFIDLEYEEKILKLKVLDTTEFRRKEAFDAGKPFLNCISYQEPYKSLYTKEFIDGRIFIIKITTYEDETGKLCLQEEVIEKIK